MPAGPTFGSPAWTALFLHAVETAHKLGLEITLTITSGWDLGAPFIQPKDGMKILTWSRTMAENGETHFLQPKPMNAFYQRIAVLAYPLRHGPRWPARMAIARAPISNLKRNRPLQKRADRCRRAPIFSLIRQESLATKTRMSGRSRCHQFRRRRGALHWTPPTPGPWEILNIGYTNSGITLSPGSGAWQGLSLDTLSPATLNFYWDKEVTPLLNAAKPYLGNTVKYVTTDSWEMGGMNWTENFRAEFIKRTRIRSGALSADRYRPHSHQPRSKRSISCRSSPHRGRPDQSALRHHGQACSAFRSGRRMRVRRSAWRAVDALETFRHSAVPQTEFWAMSKVHRSADTDRYFVKRSRQRSAHLWQAHRCR